MSVLSCVLTVYYIISIIKPVKQREIPQETTALAKTKLEAATPIKGMLKLTNLSQVLLENHFLVV